MNIEVYVKELRTGADLAKGTVTTVSNQYSRGYTRKLSLMLNTGYEVVVYLTVEEMRKLLDTFQEEAVATS